VLRKACEYSPSQKLLGIAKRLPVYCGVDLTEDSLLVGTLLPLMTLRPTTPTSSDWRSDGAGGRSNGSDGESPLANPEVLAANATSLEVMVRPLVREAATTGAKENDVGEIRSLG